MKAGTSLGQGNKWDPHPAQLVPAPAPAWPPMSLHVPGYMGHEPTPPADQEQPASTFLCSPGWSNSYFAPHTVSQTLLQTLKSDPLAGTGPSAAATEPAVAPAAGRATVPLCPLREQRCPEHPPRERGDQMAEPQLCSFPTRKPRAEISTEPAVTFPAGSPGAEPRGTLTPGHYTRLQRHTRAERSRQGVTTTGAPGNRSGLGCDSSMVGSA